MNPLLSMMKPNLKTVNPQQMLLNALQTQNPQGYQQVMQMMSSGMNPQEILGQMTNKLTPEQVNQIKAMASQFGIKL